MDSTPSDFAAASSGLPAPAATQPARGGCIWIPLVLGVAVVVMSSAYQEFARSLFFDFLNVPFVYTHQALIQYAAYLTAPVIVVLIAIAIALWAPGITRRWVAVARLLSALALEVAVTVFGLPALLVYLTPLMTPPPGAPPGRPPLGNELIGDVISSLLYVSLGVTLAVVMGVVTPGAAPRAWLRRLGYWLLVGALVGLAATCLGLLGPFIEGTLLAARLGAASAFDCQSGNMPLCYGVQLLYLARFEGIGTVLGLALGGAVGGFLAPQLTRHGAAPFTADAEPPVSAERRARASRARGYLAGFGLGVAYVALEVFLLWAVSNGSLAIQSRQPLALSITVDAAALLIPAGWLALVVARGRLAALNEGGRGVLRWALIALAALSALVIPLLASRIAGTLYATNFVVSLIAFSFGMAYGLVWSPPVRMALAGWLGVAIPAAVLIGLAVYSLMTYNAATSGCHGLGCGGLLLVGYPSIVSPLVYLIIYGLLVAAAGGWLAGILRAALVLGAGERAGDTGAE